MTNYLILRATNEPGTSFNIEGEFQANSAADAARGYARAEDWDADEIVVAAVPVRFWAVLKLQMEVTTQRKVTPL